MNAGKIMVQSTSFPHPPWILTRRINRQCQQNQQSMMKHTLKILQSLSYVMICWMRGVVVWTRGYYARIFIDV